MASELMALQVARRPDHCVVSVSGELSLGTMGELQRGLAKLLLDAGHVLVDLSGLTVSWSPAVQVFPSALAAAGGWPAARLVLFGADDPTAGALRGARVATTVPVAADGEAARFLLQIRPGRIIRRAEMPCDVAAPARARAVVDTVRADWSVTGRYHDAALVATELVTNAVEHARTRSLLVVSLDVHGLHVAVRDFAPDGVEAIRSGAGATGGRGLFLVSELTRAWGVTAHDDGKTVWALLGR